MSEDGDKLCEEPLPLSLEGEAQVEERDGQKLLRFDVPPHMQGHTFALNLYRSAVDAEPIGPFKFEFVLGSEFALYEPDLSAVNFAVGFSHLTCSESLSKVRLSLVYAQTDTPEQKRETTLTLKSMGGRLSRIIVKAEDKELRPALARTNAIIADLLDWLCLVHRVAISLHHIEITDSKETFISHYTTLPYGRRVINAENLTDAKIVPPRLRGAARLFREGLNSGRPPYRLLCLYRVREVVQRVRDLNDEEVVKLGIKPQRPVRLLGKNQLTDKYFAEYVEKKVGAFLDHVRTEYRLAIAHGNLDEYFKLVLDPADVRIDHRIDFTNAALAPVVSQMIVDEAEFMRTHGIATLPRVD